MAVSENNLKNNDVSISKLCSILSVSRATANNWIRLNKIIPDYSKNSISYFKKENVDKLIKKIKSDSSVLKSRRNKKYISGSFFYKDYISQNSKNIPLIADVLNYINQNKIILKKSEIGYILADCAKKLLGYDSALLDDLIDDKNKRNDFIKKYPDLFKNYIYEKNEDILGLLYISLSNLGNRKSKGAYYTPSKTVKKVINSLKFSLDKKILDPCCGSGNFLLHLPQNIKIDNIFGFDIDPIAIKITRINMALKYGIKDTKILYKNFEVKDFLSDDNEKFDYIIGNPPWGADFSKEITQKLKKLYLSTQGKNIESYDVFIEKSLLKLNENGYLTFILPEAILTVKTHQIIRDIILKNNSLTYIEYLGNIFDNVYCPSVILQIKHTGTKLSTKNLKIVNKNRSFVIKKEREVTKEVFTFLSDEEYEIYNKIINNNNLYLKDNADFALGLVTGDNKKYISDRKTKDNEIILKGSDIEKFKINEPSNYIIYTPQKFQQVAPDKLYRAKEKLFYRFISKELVFAYDNQGILSLNSCNILIPKIEGLEIKYIMAILNSPIAQFIFEKKYNSVKVLRSHIESIPIPNCSKEKQKEIIKLIDKKDYEKLNNEIYKLYGLSKKEYEMIKQS